MFLILFSVLGVSFTVGPSPQDFYIFLGIIPNFSLSWLSYLLTSVAENKHGCNSLILSFFSMVIAKCWSANGALFISHIHCKSPFSPQNSSKSFFFFFTILLDMCACSQDLTNIDSFAHSDLSKCSSCKLCLLHFSPSDFLTVHPSSVSLLRSHKIDIYTHIHKTTFSPKQIYTALHRRDRPETT